MSGSAEEMAKFVADSKSWAESRPPKNWGGEAFQAGYLFALRGMEIVLSKKEPRDGTVQASVPI